MEATLNKKSIHCFKKVHESCLTREETAESVVPDVLPDISEIIDADGLVLLRSKESEKGRVSLAGLVNATVLYLPDGGSGVNKLELAIPFSANAESAELTDDARPVVSARLISISARLLNPRKVLVRAEVAIDLACYIDGVLEIYDGVDSNADENILTLTNTSKMNPTTCVREKTFVITDEYQIPAAKPGLGELLKQRVELMVDDIKTVGNKLVFKGAAQVYLMYLGQEDAGPVSASFTTSFSQILEVDNISEQPEAQICLMITGAYFEPMSVSHDNRGIGAELHIVAQAVCSENLEIDYIADAYSNDYALNLISNELEVTAVDRKATVRETIRDVVETAQPVRELVHIYPVAGVAEVQGGKVKCPIQLHGVVKDDSGHLLAVTKQVVFESSIEIDADMKVTVLGIRCDDTYASGTVSGLEIRMSVDAELLITQHRLLNTITSIDVDEEAPLESDNKPSVTVLNAGEEDNIWNLAKNYRSTPQLILSANELEGPENLKDKPILIPKAR